MSNAPLVFSHLKSFSFGLENDIQGIKRALELRSTNGLNRNSIEEDELFLKDLHNNALNTQIKYTQIEDSVFGPIENRLSYVTVEEMNERFQELLESNNKIIQGIMQRRRAANPTMDISAQTLSTANFDNNSKSIVCDSMNSLEKSIDTGDESVDYSNYDNRSELQSSFNDHLTNNFSHTSMEENKDGEFLNITPNKIDNDKVSDLTPESPDISPTFKIKFQSSYTNNASKNKR